MAKSLGFVMVAVLWMVVLVPIIGKIVHFIRTTSAADLRPEIRRVRVVSAQRARMQPGRWIPINRWACKERA